jgi:thiol-disulfide isomerase/thioredoxin
MRYDTAMQTSNTSRGIAALPVILVLVAVAVAAAYFTRPDDGAMMEKSPSPSPSAMMEKKDDGAMMEESPSPSPSAMMEKKDDGAMMKKEEGAMMQKASVAEYTKAAYDAAVASGKPVVLYYYANWCPICRVEFLKFQSAVAGRDAAAATYFRVSYNDSDTSADEKASAQQHQVGSQHTVVVVKGGQQTYKSQSTGDYAVILEAQLK